MRRCIILWSDGHLLCKSMKRVCFLSVNASIDELLMTLKGWLSNTSLRWQNWAWVVLVCQTALCARNWFKYLLSGYKLHEKIGKSLKTQADAIQSALKRYNEAAALMVPPQPLLSWELVVAAVNIAEFNLLKNMPQDIRKFEWAQPANLEGMVMYFKIKCAKEEIICLNIEIQRLLTFLYDVHVDHYRAVC